MDRKEKKYMHFSTQTHAHTQNMGQDNNLHPENVHTITIRTLMDRNREEIHALLKHKYSLKTWDKTTTHILRM